MYHTVGALSYLLAKSLFVVAAGSARSNEARRSTHSLKSSGSGPAGTSTSTEDYCLGSMGILTVLLEKVDHLRDKDGLGTFFV